MMTITFYKKKDIVNEDKNESLLRKENNLSSIFNNQDSTVEQFGE